MVAFLSFDREFREPAFGDFSLGRVECPFRTANEVDHAKHKVGNAQHGDCENRHPGEPQDLE